MYAPLPTDTSIRVLHVEDVDNLGMGPNCAPIIYCHTKIIDLGDEGMHPPYTCLSYTWGSPFPPSTPLSSQYGADTGTKGPYLTISVDGEEIAVTRSLCEALHQLRQSVPGKLQPIWIDAICIDQRHPEGNVERGKQVTMMDRIYSTAEHVLVWLGPTDHHAASAIPALRRLASVTIHALQATVDVEEPLSTSDPELYEKLEIPFITRNQWKQVRGFYERTWFQRTWVTQEAALARSISFHMGSHTLSWDQIEKAASVIYRVTGLFPDRFNRSPGIVQICLNPNEDTDATELTSLAWNSIRSIDMLRKEQKEYGSTRSYHQRIQLGDEAMVVATREYHDNPAAWREFRTHVLHKNREKKSSDPRDKIYGILGLLRGMVDEQGKKLIAPNYDEENSTKKLYTDITRRLFLEQSKPRFGNPDTLPLYGSATRVPPVEDRSMRNVPGLPSWVPDFSAKELPAHMMSAAYFTFRASGHLMGDFVETKSPYKYGLRGLPVDGITNVGESYDELKESLSISRCLHLVARLTGKTLGGMSQAQVLASTLSPDLHVGFQIGMDEKKAIFRSYLGVLKAIHIGCQNGREGRNVDAEDALRLEIEQSCPEFHILEDGWRPQTTDVMDILSALKSNKPPNSWPRSLKTLFGRASRYEANLNLHFSGRRFFSTSNGMVGLGPQSLRPGDEVWLFPPEKTFHVLRPLRGGEYELMGDAYVHGIMFGEFAKTRREVDLRVVHLV